MIPVNSSAKYGVAGQVQRMLREAFDDEYDYLLQGADDKRLGWMPFQIADFTAIMTEVMRETDGVHFLEVGSGVGTKSAIARHLFGLTTFGIEYSRELAEVALDRQRGPLWIGDALDFPYSYGEFDIIWMYRPFRNVELQDRLEEHIYDKMRPGAILAGAALQNAPSGWTTIVDDWDMGNRGAWKKP
jgi:SAM-dependent methyltransferase